MTVAGQTDALAQEIRRVDGENRLGAGALAEALMPFIAAQHRREAEAGAPEGWVLVPRELTLEMEQAHYDAHAKAETVFASAQDVWSAMLAASPSPPASGVRVKALDFRPAQHPKRLQAVSVLGAYVVLRRGSKFALERRYGTVAELLGLFDHAEAATGAGNADYEARIRSALGEHS